MPDAPPPTLRLNIDRDALAHNWRALDRMSGEARAGAAIKAQCYGLGIEPCLPVLAEAGARDFFVAHWSEVAEAAQYVSADSIAVLHGVLNAEEATYAKAVGAVPVINSLQQARIWSEAGGGPCHLMVDTGMNRLGIAPDEAGDPAVSALDVQVLMSHLACADEDSAMNARQLAAFRDIASAIQHRELSLANSAGIALDPQFRFDLTRPGLALYGGVPRPELADTIRQVAYPQTALLHVRLIGAGDSVGYNATFSAERDMRVGIVTLGYADGILRCWGGQALGSADDPLPILGRVSMDMIALDLSRHPALHEGDWIDVPYRLPDAARQTSLSQYELLTLLGRRLRP